MANVGQKGLFISYAEYPLFSSLGIYGQYFFSANSIEDGNDPTGLALRYSLILTPTEKGKGKWEWETEKEKSPKRHRSSNNDKNHGEHHQQVVGHAEGPVEAGCAGHRPQSPEINGQAEDIGLAEGI